MVYYSGLKDVNLFDMLLATRDEQRERSRDAVIVVRGSDLPLEHNRQGYMRWYLHPAISDAATQALLFYVQEIPPLGRSGTQLFQGGQVIYVWKGRGFTEIDGRRHYWEEGDVVSLPIWTEGMRVSHQNGDESVTAKLVVASPNWTASLGVDMGSGFEQLDNATDWKEQAEC